MSIYDEYQIVINEAQRRLIMRALTNAMADDRRSTGDGALNTAIKTWYDPTIPTATKTPTGALVSVINLACSGEGCTWRERVTFHLGKGYLAYKTNWRSRDKCE